MCSYFPTILVALAIIALASNCNAKGIVSNSEIRTLSGLHGSTFGARSLFDDQDEPQELKSTESELKSSSEILQKLRDQQRQQQLLLAQLQFGQQKSVNNQQQLQANPQQRLALKQLLQQKLGPQQQFGQQKSASSLLALLNNVKLQQAPSSADFRSRSSKLSDFHLLTDATPDKSAGPLSSASSSAVFQKLSEALKSARSNQASADASVSSDLLPSLRAAIANSKLRSSANQKSSTLSGLQHSDEPRRLSGLNTDAVTSTTSGSSSKGNDDISRYLTVDTSANSGESHQSLLADVLVEQTAPPTASEVLKAAKILRAYITANKAKAQNNAKRLESPSTSLSTNSGNLKASLAASSTGQVAASSTGQVAAASSTGQVAAASKAPALLSGLSRYSDSPPSHLSSGLFSNSESAQRDSGSFNTISEHLANQIQVRLLQASHDAIQKLSDCKSTGGSDAECRAAVLAPLAQAASESLQAINNVAQVRFN